MDKNSKNERIGVNIVNSLCVKNNWIFRECFVEDIGIDANIEYYDEKNHESKNLLGLQIKCGPSYFTEEDGDSYIFRFDENHKLYWESYLMPIVLVLCNPSDESAFYTILNEETIVSTGKGYKVNVKKDSSFEDFLREKALSIKKMPKYIYNYNYLLSHLDLMQAINNGYDVVLRAHEWVNKSSGRGHISIWIYDDTKIVDIIDWNYWFPFQLYEDVIVRLFPWADFTPDDEFMEDEDENYDNLELILEARLRSGEALYEEGIDYDARRHIKSILRAGEVAFYELHLSLNELGNAFLSIHKKLNVLKIYKEVKSSIRENHEYINFETVFKDKHPFKE